MSFGIEFLDIEADFENFSTLVKETYGPNSVLLNKAFLKWWFAQSPFKSKARPSDILVAKYKGKIVGMSGQMETQVISNGSVYPFTWFANTMVHEDYRRGVGVMLVGRGIQEYRNVGSISFNNNSEPLIDYYKFNKFNNQKLQRYAIILKSSTLSAPFAITNADEKAKRVAGVHANAIAQPGTIFLEKAEKLWQTVAPRYKTATHRSAAFLDWKYQQNTQGTYYFITDNTENPQAIAVTRIDGQDFKALRIIDLFGTETAVFTVLQAAIKFAFENGVYFVDFQCTHTPDSKAFEEAGYTFLNEEEKSTVPFLLNPVTVQKKFNENLALKPVDFEINSFDEVYFTKGDGDRDRPQ